MKVESLNVACESVNYSTSIHLLNIIMAASKTAPSESDLASRVPSGVVLPPVTIRAKIETVAGYVVRSGPQFEEVVRKKNAGTNQTTFLEAGDAYEPYYRWRLDEIKGGRGFNENDRAIASKTDVTFAGREHKAPPKPEDFHFSARMPNISAQDLDIVKLTAQYAAKNGRAWVTQLSQREGGNYQFDFLRQQHSLNMFFNRLTEQYKDLLEGETSNGGAAQKARIEELERNLVDRGQILDRAKQRAQYVKYQEAQRVEVDEKAEKKKLDFAQIDWHDFTVIATITHDERDEHTEMPPPKTLNDMQSLSLEEKQKLRIGSDRRIEEAVPDFNDYETIYGHAPQMPAAQMPQGWSPQPTPPQQQTPFVAPDLATERAAARAATAAAASTPQAAKTRIRNDYIPQAAAARARNQANTSICPNCKQAIPNEEMQEHMRIEMLDPQWREQSRKDQQRSSTTNLSTQDVAANLKRLASQRSDVFDPVTGRAVADAGAAKTRKMDNANGGGGGGDVNDQIRRIHEKHGK